MKLNDGAGERELALVMIRKETCECGTLSISHHGHDLVW
jgi:hypothetical protein